MVALGSLLVIVTISFLIVRIASQALALTGLSEDSARFQARSALTGTGFTTEEAEHVVNHPVRRRIISLLMLLQSVGLVTIVAASVLSFVNTGSSGESLKRLLILVLGLLALWLFATSRWVDRWLNRVIKHALEHWTQLGFVDFYALLRVEEDYQVMRMQVEKDNWLEDRRLIDLRLPAEGVTVLGIIRSDGSYVGVPRGDTTLHAEDVLIVYGLQERLNNLRGRVAGASGDQEHDKAVRTQEEEESRQEMRERDFEMERRESGKEG